MRRAERLFQIVQMLRSRNVTTAARLAEELEVSERTIYRDIADLVSSGVPIDGEAGVGYIMRGGFDLPPLMFTPEEIEALVLGARVVMSWTDPAMARAARDVLGKVEAVLPERLRASLAETALFAPNYGARRETQANLTALRTCMHERRKVRFGYTREDGARSTRTVQPLGLFFWGATWSVAGWCEHRDAFRSFRLDRIEGLRVLDQNFEDVPGRTLNDYLREPGPVANAAGAPAAAAE